MRQGRLRRTIACLAVGFAVAACNAGTATTLTTPPTTDDALTLTLQHSPAGPILATGAGFTLYDFGPDTTNHSTCVNAGCVFQWPPLEVSGPISVGPGVRRSLVGTLRRPDGTVQVSYAGRPLYTYVLDSTAGWVTGQGIDQDGGPWWVLNARGKEVHASFTVNG